MPAVAEMRNLRRRCETRVVACAVAALIVAAAALAGPAAAGEQTSDDTDTPATSSQPDSADSADTVPPAADERPQAPAQCDPLGVGVLMLYDTSSSLRRSDPQGQRKRGGRAALGDLQRIASEFDTTAVDVAVSGFASSYDAGTWQRLGNDDTSLIPADLADRFDTIASDDDGGFTDYRAALAGAAETFSAVPLAHCKRLIWFTDGVHDTERGSGSSLTGIESAEVDAMCAVGGANAELRRLGAQTTVVLLSNGADGVPEPMLRLFGRSPTRDCPVPLQGEIAEAVDVSDLAGLLRSNVEDSTWEGIEAPPETVLCTAARTAGTCTFAFEVPQDAPAFDIYVNLKHLDNPDVVTITAIPPSGKTVDPFEFGETREMHPGTGLLAWAATGRWRHISGHIAAADTAGETSDSGTPDWAGTWKLVFEGPDSDSVRVTPPRVVTHAVPDVTAAVSADGDTVTGTAGAVPNAEAAVVLRLGDDDEPLGRSDGYRVADDGTWQASGIREAATEALSRSGADLSLLLPVTATVQYTIEWGTAVLVWEPTSRPAVVLVELPGSSGPAARSCSVTQGSSDLTCRWSFAVDSSHEAFTVRFAENAEHITSGRVEVSMLMPSGRAVAADFGTGPERSAVLAGIGPQGEAQMHAHHAAAQNEWEGPWQVAATGRFDAVGGLSAPRLTLTPHAVVGARLDSTGALSGTVRRPSDSTGDEPQGRVLVRIDAPGHSLHDELVGSSDGRPIRSGRWEAPDIVAEVMEVLGIRSLLRETGGEVAVTVRHLAELEWGGNDETGSPDDEPIVLRWEGGLSAAVKLSIPSALGWDSEWIHPWATAVTFPADTGDGPALEATVTVRQGLESGTLRVDNGSLRDESGTSFDLDLSDWSCEVPSPGTEAFTGCPPLLVDVSAASPGQAALTVTFASWVDNEEELLAEADKRGLRTEATHLYAPVLQPALTAATVLPGGGFSLLMVVFAVVVLLVVAAGVMVWRRR